MLNINKTSENIKVESLLECEKKVSDSLAGARVYLKKKFKLVNQDDPSVGGGWSQFLNEESRNPTITGTAHGLILLITCGEKPDSDIIKFAKIFISNNIRSDGGWTKPDLVNYCSLTRISCLALRALLDAGESFTSPIVVNGIAWLIKAQNYDGGWGNIPNDQISDVTSTSFALQALVKIPNIHKEGKKAIYLGREWLLESRNSDDSWGYSAGKKGTIAQTSEAVEGLLASGERPSTLSSTLAWLLENIHEDSQFVERYLINTQLIKEESLIWTQVTKERGLIALLKLGSSVTAPEVINLVKKILDTQINMTYWRPETHADSEPLWAMKEAVISLHLFYNSFEHDRSTILLSNEISYLKSEVESYCDRLTYIENHIYNSSAKARFFRFLSFIIKPVNLTILITGLIILVYLYLRNFKLPQYAEILLGVLAIVGVTLTLYQIIIKPSKQQEQEK